MATNPLPLSFAEIVRCDMVDFIQRAYFSRLREAVLEARNGDESSIERKLTEITICEAKFGHLCVQQLLKSIEALNPPGSQ